MQVDSGYFCCFATNLPSSNGTQSIEAYIYTVMFLILGFNPSKKGCPLIVLDEANTKFVVNWTLRKLQSN